jgi:2-methylcitrate dehydratase PrpD
MDIIRMLVRNVLETSYEDIPKEAIAVTKLAILDTIGCMIAGVGESGCDVIREQVVDWGGKKESTILGYGDKVPCPNAVLVTGTMARALDYDTVWERGLHMSAASVPAAIAVAELRGGLSGRDFITALVAGEDLAARIHLATSDYNGFEPTGVCGILGIASITGKILGFDERQMLDAVAIAFNRSAGSYQPNIDGALAVRVMQGLASRSGIESALFAARGITGGEGVLQGTYGYFHLFSGAKYDAQVLTNGLGKEFLGAREPTFKKYPACGGTTTAIEASLELVNQHNIRPEQVDEITVDSSRFFFHQLGKPFRVGTNPQVDAQFSYQYTVANVVVRRRFTLEDITPEAIGDPEVLRMVAKVQTRPNDDLVKESTRATIVAIRRKDGRRFSKQMNFPTGSKQRPISRDEVREKFESCARFGQRKTPKARIDQIVKIVDKLEEIEDVRDLSNLLGGVND